MAQTAVISTWSANEVSVDEIKDESSYLKVRGAAKRKSKDYDGALEDLNNADRLEPDQAFILKERGTVKYELGDYKGALIDFTRADNLEPQCPFTLKYQGEVKRIQKDYYGALEDLNNARKLESDDSFTLSRLGIVKRELLNYGGALQDLNRAVELDPENAFILRQRGLVKRGLRFFEGALEDLNKANNLEPNNAFTLAQRGVVNREIMYFEDALKDLNVADALDPDDAFNLQQRGVVKKALMDFENAFHDLNRANNICPNDAYTLRHRGITRRELQDFEGALEDLNKSSDLDPNNDITLSERGVTKKGLEDYKGAIEDLNLANYITPGHAFTLKQRGVVRRILGDMDGALEDLDLANKLEPNDSFTLIERGMTKKRIKDYEGALSDFNSANALHPDDPFILQHRGSLRRMMGDHVGSLRDLNLASELQPNNVHALRERSHTRRASHDILGVVEDSNKASQLEGFHRRLSFKGGPLKQVNTSSLGLMKTNLECDQQPQARSNLQNHVPSTLVIDFKRLEFQKHLGRGSCGLVDKCKWNGKMVAVKYIVGQSGRLLQDFFQSEVTMLAKLQHPRVVRLIGCAFDNEQNQGILVMELMSNNLRNIIDIHKRRYGTPFSPLVAIDIMTQIAEAMEHLHDHEVLHRDLKSNNILVNPRERQFSRDEEYFEVKVADLGMSKCKHIVSHFYTMNVGATPWRAPEVFGDASRGRYSWPADVWSFAMTCYEVLSGDVPFEGISLTNIRQQILRGVRPTLSEDFRRKHGVMSALLQKCWSFNPLVRPTFSHIRKTLILYRSLLCQDLGHELRKPGDLIKVDQISKRHSDI